MPPEQAARERPASRCCGSPVPGRISAAYKASPSEPARSHMRKRPRHRSAPSGNASMRRRPRQTGVRYHHWGKVRASSLRTRRRAVNRGLDEAHSCGNRCKRCASKRRSIERRVSRGKRVRVSGKQVSERARDHNLHLREQKNRNVVHTADRKNVGRLCEEQAAVQRQQHLIYDRGLKSAAAPQTVRLHVVPMSARSNVLL